MSLSVLLVVDLVLGGTGPARRLQTEEAGGRLQSFVCNVLCDGRVE